MITGSAVIFPRFELSDSSLHEKCFRLTIRPSRGDGDVLQTSIRQ